MPWGASAGAAEAIEFGELSGAGRYRALAGQLDGFETSMWRAPAFVIERERYALCDAQGASALFFGAAVTEWLDAWLEQGETVAVALRNVGHIDDLHVLPYWLARRGHAALVLSAAHGRESGAARDVQASAARGGDDAGWHYAAWAGSCPVPGALFSFMAALSGGGAVPEAPAWQAVLRDGAAWLSGEPAAAGDASTAADLPAGRFEGAHAVVVATRRGATGDFTAGTPARSLDARRLAALHRQAMSDGWPMPRETWERLMRFADRSLIPTSERSREGAG